MRRMLLLTMLTLAGCAAVGPDYQPPEVPVPSQWRLADREMRASAGPGWWRHFKDPVLEELIRIALEENKDLKISSARIEEYQARYAVTRAEQFPQIGAEASGTRSRAPSIGTPPGQAALRACPQLRDSQEALYVIHSGLASLKEPTDDPPLCATRRPMGTH